MGWGGGGGGGWKEWHLISPTLFSNNTTNIYSSIINAK